jgi:hypothetical protein
MRLVNLKVKTGTTFDEKKFSQGAHENSAQLKINQRNIEPMIRSDKKRLNSAFDTNNKR